MPKMEMRGRFTFGDHTTHVEYLDGSNQGFRWVHVVHCTCGDTSKPIIWTDHAEEWARAHIYEAKLKAETKQ